MRDIRATTLNCMDGRVQLPVLQWIHDHYTIDYVDVITEAGMDGVLAHQADIQEILRSINVSVNLNKSTRLFIVGHHDCRGNRVDESVHREQIVLAVKRIQGHWPAQDVVGLWVNQEWKVEVVPLK